MSDKSASSKRSSRAIRAAGGVVWQVRDGATHVALVHRPHYDDWSLPKGKLDAGEWELAAAVREIAEEIGSRVAVSRRLTGVAYNVGHERKTVAYWTMRHLDGEFAANHEVDELAWLPVDAARERADYDADRTVLDDFAALPVPDSVVVVVRHAKAGKRSEWHDHDDLRPLEAAGRAQARRLSTFLQAFAPDLVVSADPVRCVQTVQPIADALGLAVTVDPVFGDEAWSADPRATETALLALAKPRRVAVVSSQGGAIPGLIETLAPDVRSGDTRKGAAWVLSFVDDAVIAADYYPSAAR